MSNPAGAAKTAGKQRGRPFAAGRSGNPKGRPQGSRHKTTILVEELLEMRATSKTRLARIESRENPAAPRLIAVEVQDGPADQVAAGVDRALAEARLNLGPRDTLVMLSRFGPSATAPRVVSVG